MKKEVVFHAIGRRKCATAKVLVLNTKGNLIINNKLAEDYFHYNLNYLKEIQAPLKKVNYDDRYQIIIKVFGGGLTGQANAIKLALARVLCSIDNENRRPLKLEGFLKSDARIKERRKYGLKKARKASQYSKR